MTSQWLLRSPALRQIESACSGLPLMQRAGAAAASWAAELARDGAGGILVIAGPGNNGGDAFITAALLRHWQFDVTLLQINTESATQQPDAALARAAYLAAGGVITEQIPASSRHWRLIIDGIFGIGLSRPPCGQAAEAIVAINALAKTQHCPILALDCPSGLNADSGQALGDTVNASHTLSFIAAKPGLYTGDGPDHCGEIRIANLDLSAETIANVADGQTISRQLFASCLQTRRRNSHKGSHGSAGILGGAPGMLGAALLAGRAALHGGAGRVYLGLLDSLACDLLQPELMLKSADTLLAGNLPLSALAAGCGLGSSQQALRLLQEALALPLPLLLDADALNLLAQSPELQTLLASRSAPGALTPHPAEAARLLGCNTADIANDRIAAAITLAQRYGCHVVIKGCGSIVAAPNGQWWLNTSGNPALATAGSGDVLSGLLVALLAQGWPMQEATLAAVHLHGAAADALVAAGEGPLGISAGEIIPAARRLLNHWIAEKA